MRTHVRVYEINTSVVIVNSERGQGQRIRYLNQALPPGGARRSTVVGGVIVQSL